MATLKGWQTIREALSANVPFLEKARQTVVDEQVSNYPIFVAYRGGEISTLGIPVLQLQDLEEPQNINITTLEELVTKQVVKMEEVDNFRNLYKSRSKYLCFLIFQEGEANFAFLPNTEQHSSAGED